MKIKRSDFLKAGFFLSLSPIILSSGLICTGDVLTEPGSSNNTKLDKLINELPSYTIAKNSSVETGVYKIPSSAIITNGNSSIVCKIIDKGDNYYLQGVQVSICEQNDLFSNVSGLNAGDKVILEQSSSLKYLNRIAHNELKKKFLRLKTISKGEK